MKRVDQLIDRVRSWTENNDVSANAGIPDQDFVDALSDGQDMLEGAVYRNVPYCSWFDFTTTYTLVATEESVDLPFDCYYRDGVRKVEFSKDADPEFYYPLEPENFLQRSVVQAPYPSNYSISGGRIYLSPPPSISGGTLRVTYARKLPTLANTVGIVSAFSTNITLANDTFLDATTLADAVPGYFSLIRRLDGAVISRSLTATAYDSGTRVLTVSVAPTYESGFSSSDVVSAFLVPGRSATNIPAWPQGTDAVERYLRNYAIWKIFRRESSTDTSEQGNELSAIEADIVQAANAAQGDYGVIDFKSCDW